MTDILTDDMIEQATLPKNAIEKRVTQSLYNYSDAWAFFDARSDALFKLLKRLVLAIIVILGISIMGDRLRETWQFIIEIWYGICLIFYNIAFACFGSGLSHVFWIVFIPSFLFGFAMMPKKRGFLTHIDLDMTREFPVHVRIYQKTDVFNEASLRCEPPGDGFFDWWYFKDIKRAILNIFGRLREYRIVPSSYNTKNMLKCKFFDNSGADINDYLDEGIVFFTTSCGDDKPVVSVVETEDGEEMVYIRSSRINNISQVQAIIEWPEKDKQTETIREQNMMIASLNRQLNDNITTELYPVVDAMLNRDDVKHINALHAFARPSAKSFYDDLKKESKTAMSKAVQEKEAEYTQMEEES